MKKNRCPNCGEVGSFENRAFKRRGIRRCKNEACRIRFFNEEVPDEEAEFNPESVKKAMDYEKLEKLRDAVS